MVERFNNRGAWKQTAVVRKCGEPHQDYFVPERWDPIADDLGSLRRNGGRITLRSSLNVLRAASGIPAKYSSTFFGATLAVIADLRDFVFFIKPVCSQPEPFFQNKRMALACSIAQTFLSSANTGSGTAPSTCTTAMASRGLALPVRRPREKSAMLIL